MVEKRTVREIIEQRRSIRKYKPDPIDKKIIKQLLESARLAPSSSNRQSWYFVVVEDKEVKEKIVDASFNQRFLAEAPVVIICCGDPRTQAEYWRKLLELKNIGLNYLDEDTYHKLLETDASEGKINLYQSITALVNVAIATEHIVLQAEELGLGTCWVKRFEADKIKEILKLPDYLMVVALLSVGYPDESPEARPRKNLEEITSFNK